MYHVGVSNIFALLDDENDESPKVTPDASSKSTGKAPAPQGQSGVKSKQPVTKNEKANDTRGKSDAKGDRNAKPTRGESGGVSKVEGEHAQRRQQSKGERGERRNARGAEGGAGGERGATTGPRGKRLYDRKSGTGRGKEVKKGGSGKANWGTSEDDQKVQSDVAAEHAEESQAKEEAKEGEAKADAPETEEERKKREEREKEEKQIDLEEYKKRLSEKAPKVTLPEARRVEENSKQWSNYVPIKRDDAEVVQIGKAKKSAKEGAKENAKEGKDEKKKSVPVDQVFKVQTEEKRARGGFRNGKGNAKNSYSKGGKRNSAAAPSLDASSFPALSTKPVSNPSS